MQNKTFSSDGHSIHKAQFKTHILWREGRTVNRDGHSAHKAQFKNSLAVERTQKGQQGWTFSL
jgi:hypothetical protein